MKIHYPVTIKPDNICFASALVIEQDLCFTIPNKISSNC